MKNGPTAIAVLFPGVWSSHVSNASEQHGVQVLIKEQYNPQKNYQNMYNSIKALAAGSMALLFVFSDGSNMIAKDAKGIAQVLKRIVERQGIIL